MTKIAVVVDSTAVIDKEIVEANSNLFVIPLQIIISDNTYSDGVDLTPSEFFEKMSQSEQLPTTSQPSVGELSNLFNDILETYEHIIYITLSSKISGTYQTGVMVRSMISEEKITVFDSLHTATIQKQMVIETLKLIKEDKSIEDIVNNLKFIRDNAAILLVVGDLQHLHRTGRIGLATASIGSALKIKPVLVFEQGAIVVKQKIRTAKKAHANLVKMITEAQLSSNSKILIAHANGYEYALTLKDEVQKIYPHHDISIDELSPVISVHTGPNTVGLSWISM